MVLDLFLIIFTVFVAMVSVIAISRNRQRKAVDAAYNKGLADAKQTAREVINDIKIKVNEGKSFHKAADEVANEMKRMLKETNLQ